MMDSALERAHQASQRGLCGARSAKGRSAEVREAIVDLCEVRGSSRRASSALAAMTLIELDELLHRIQRDRWSDQPAVVRVPLLLGRRAEPMVRCALTDADRRQPHPPSAAASGQVPSHA